MTKKLGTDFDPHEERRKPLRIVAWAFDLLFPLGLVLIAVALSRYGFSFW